MGKLPKPSNSQICPSFQIYPNS